MTRTLTKPERKVDHPHRPLLRFRCLFLLFVDVFISVFIGFANFLDVVVETVALAVGVAVQCCCCYW